MTGNKISEQIGSRGDMWRFAGWYPDPPDPAFRISGPATPTPVIPFDSRDDRMFYLKREDLNPCGSHKERAACYQVSKLRESGNCAAVISSTGNAARAAARYLGKIGGILIALMSPGAHPGKIRSVLDEYAHVILTPKPVNHTRYISRRLGLPDLRPSLDPRAVHGFMSLGFEIFEQFPDRPPESVFIFSTSGASLLGIALAFETVTDKLKLWPHSPQLHAAQSGRALFLAREFDPRAVEDEPDSPAGKGALAESRLSAELGRRIRRSGGGAWAVRKDEIDRTLTQLHEAGIHTSEEGAAAVAAAHRSRRFRQPGSPLVLLTGSVPLDSTLPDSDRLVRVSGYSDVLDEAKRILGIS